MPNFPSAKQIGSAILHFRIRKGLSQAELAQLIGWPPERQSTISEYENGHTAPQPKTLRAIAAALGCEVANMIDVSYQMPA